MRLGRRDLNERELRVDERAGVFDAGELREAEAFRLTFITECARAEKENTSMRRAHAGVKGQVSACGSVSDDCHCFDAALLADEVCLELGNFSTVCKRVA